MSAPTLDDLRKLVARTEGAAPSHMNASTIRELRAAAAWALGRIEELEGVLEQIAGCGYLPECRRLAHDTRWPNDDEDKGQA